MNKVVHFEIPADDVARAEKFYKTVFDWRATKVPEMDYVMVQTTEIDEKTRMPKEVGSINGGMMKRQKPIMSPVITIAVDDIDESLITVEENEGRGIE